jgi:hypothetical protein
MVPNYRTQMTEAMGSLNKSKPCIVCCGKNKSLQIIHKHLSTAHYNRQMTRLGEMSPMCYFCDKHHPIDHMTRNKVLLSTSTLNGVQFTQGWDWGNEQPTHVDMETIPGARIITLRKAWERAYGGNPLPIDTILVAGLNDVKYFASLHARRNTDQVAEAVSEDIMSFIKLLQTTITEHSEKFDVDDTIAVSTILHTPSMYWHDADGELPIPNYINLRTVVDKTNLKIEEFNLQHGVSSAPKFQGSGERKKGKNKRGYMFNAWREEKKEEMLHLKDPLRIKMTMAYVKYFEKATPKAYQHLE